MIAAAERLLRGDTEVTPSRRELLALGIAGSAAVGLALGGSSGEPALAGPVNVLANVPSSVIENPPVNPIVIADADVAPTERGTSALSSASIDRLPPLPS